MYRRIVLAGFIAVILAAFAVSVVFFGLEMRSDNKAFKAGTKIEETAHIPTQRLHLYDCETATAPNGDKVSMCHAIDTQTHGSYIVGLSNDILVIQEDQSHE